MLKQGQGWEGLEDMWQQEVSWLAAAANCSRQQQRHQHQWRRLRNNPVLCQTLRHSVTLCHSQGRN